MANVLQYVIDFKSRGGSGVSQQAAGLQNRLEATNASAQRLGASLKSAFMSIPGASFFTNPLVAITAGVGVVSKLGMQAESTATAFNVLVGNEEKAGKMLGRMNKYADDTIWNRKDIQEAGKTMLGFGVSTETVNEDLQRLGDIAMGDRQKLGSLALVFGQVASAGKLQGQDLLQLINAGYNPLQDIAELTGKSMATVKEEMSKGKVSYDMLRQAIVRATSEGGKFYSMTEKLAQTTGGSFEQMKGTASRVMLELYNVIQPLLIPVFQGLITVMEACVPVIKFVADAFGGFINLIKEGNPLIIGLTTLIGAWTAAIVINTTVLKGWKIAELAHYAVLVLVEKAQWAWNVAMSANPIGIVIAGILALTAALIACWNKFAGFRAVILTTWDTVKGFASILKDLLVSRITSLLQGVGKLGEALAKLFKGDFSGAWESAKSAGTLMMNIEGKKQAIQSTKAVIGGISGNYQTHLEEERKKEAAKEAISEPTAAAGVSPTSTGSTATSSGKDAASVANSITAGGTRNTQITLTIGSLIGGGMTINSGNIDESASDLQSKVLEAINRAIEIGLSAAR